MLTTKLCESLGIRLPIWNAGMGAGCAGADLAAAVSNAGGFGVLGMGGLPPAVVRTEIRRTRALTSRPFGVNILLPRAAEGQLEACLDEGVSALIPFWGEMKPSIEAAHRSGVQVIPQVGSVDEAKAAADAGADAVMIQGVEAGGHVRGTTALSIVLPAVVDAIAPLPVVAAGGVADGRGVVAALSLGAQAVSLGTRFLCSREAAVAEAYKQRVVRARAEDTVYTDLFDIGWADAPHRVLRTPLVDEWEASGRPSSGHRPGEGQPVGHFLLGGQRVDVMRYAITPPRDSFDGDIDQTALYCGQSCSLVTEITSAADIVAELVAGAEALLPPRVGA